MALSLRDRLRTLTVIELKKELKEQFSAIQTGVKEDLVERLACLIEREQARVTQAPGKKKGFYHFGFTTHQTLLFSKSINIRPAILGLSFCLGTIQVLRHHVFDLLGPSTHL